MVQILWWLVVNAILLVIFILAPMTRGEEIFMSGLWAFVMGIWASILIFVYIYERYKLVKEARKREEEEIRAEISYKREQERIFLERVRAYKTTHGSDSYS